MPNENIRVRLAPSPTGDIHIGTLRTGLYAWLLARQSAGVFILRVEDTDKAREVDGGVDLIKKTLLAFNFEWDEYYLQSELKDRHREQAQELYDKGLAYADDVSPEEVQEWRQKCQKAKKPFLYREHITNDRIVEWKYGENALRLKTNPKRSKWHDEVRGDLSAGPEAVDDFVIIKADGYPTYNFAHIVDDHDMGITHVVRTDEFLASTPKFLQVYEALGIERPKFVTLAPILASGGNKKLSKRDGAKSALDYLKDGVLVDSFINFLALLGWNPGDGDNQEIFTVEELLVKFSIKGLGKSGANFDEKRLEWINGHHIRAKNIDELYDLSQAYWPDSAANFDKEYKMQVLGLLQERLKFLNEISELSEFFFTKPKLSKKDLLDIKKLEGSGQAKEFIQAAIAELKDSGFTPEDVQDRMNKLLTNLETKPGIFFALIRNAATRAKVTPPLAESLALLGKENVIESLCEAESLL